MVEDTFRGALPMMPRDASLSDSCSLHAAVFFPVFFVAVFPGIKFLAATGLHFLAGNYARRISLSQNLRHVGRNWDKRWHVLTGDCSHWKTVPHSAILHQKQETPRPYPRQNTEKVVHVQFYRICNAYAQKYLFGMLLNQPQIRLYLPCTDCFGTENGRPFGSMSMGKW